LQTRRVSGTPYCPSLSKYRKQIINKTQFKQTLCFEANLSGSQIHWTPNDLVIVMELEEISVDGLIERPGIAGVLFGQQLLDDRRAVLHLFRHLSLLRLRDVLCGVRQVLRRLLNGSAALSSRRHLRRLRGLIGGRRVDRDTRV
jgi:hypothetical protein